MGTVNGVSSISNPRIGLALGSGGARGWCHIGVLRALEKMEIWPDAIAGSSMGALVGAAYAAGRLDELEDWACSQTKRSILGLIDVRLTGGGVVGGAEILTMLQTIGIPDRIEELPIPFVAVAADIQTGREIWLREGPLAKSIRASVAIPGVFSPERVDDHWLIDGGVVNPIPVSAARALDTDIVIAVNPDGRMNAGFWKPGMPRPTLPTWSDLLPDLPESLRGFWPALPQPNTDNSPAYLELVLTAIDIMSEQIRRSRLAGDAPHVLLNAYLTTMNALDFHRAREAIDEGERIVEAHAEWIRAVTSG
jgi:NTE family protein